MPCFQTLQTHFSSVTTPDNKKHSVVFAFGPAFIIFSSGAALLYVTLTSPLMKEDMVPGVVVYLVVLCAALWRAVARIGMPGEKRENQHLLATGYLVFIVSDVILAVDRFVYPMGQYRDVPIMITYYAAQALIALALPLHHATAKKTQ